MFQFPFLQKREMIIKIGDIDSGGGGGGDGGGGGGGSVQCVKLIISTQCGRTLQCFAIRPACRQTLSSLN